jgi:hypothetical protein
MLNNLHYTVGCNLCRVWGDSDCPQGDDERLIVEGPSLHAHWHQERTDYQIINSNYINFHLLIWIYYPLKIVN